MAVLGAKAISVAALAAGEEDGQQGCNRKDRSLDSLADLLFDSNGAQDDTDTEGQDREDKNGAHPPRALKEK